MIRLNSKTSFYALVLLLMVVLNQNATAQQNRVVVVPLGGDVSASDFNALQAQVQALQQRIQALQQRTPFAYGRISSIGVVVTDASTNNFSSTYNSGSGRYEIDFDDVSFNINRNIALATLVGSSCAGDASVRTSSVGGNLLIFIKASNGADLQCSFSFTAYNN